MHVPDAIRKEPYCRDEVVHPLDGHESTIDGNGERIAGEPKKAARLLAAVETRQRHGRSHHRETTARRDTQIDEFVATTRADGHQRVGPPSQPSLEPQQAPGQQRPEVVAEHDAVKRVHDPRHPFLKGCVAAEPAGGAGVGVDDIGGIRAHRPPQGRAGGQFAERCEAIAETGEFDETNGMAVNVERCHARQPVRDEVDSLLSS